MPLAAAASSLKSGIKDAFDDSAAAGAKAGASGDDIIEALAKGLGDAIHSYMISALVTTSDNIDAGQMDALGGMSTPGTGSGMGSLQ